MSFSESDSVNKESNALETKRTECERVRVGVESILQDVEATSERAISV